MRPSTFSPRMPAHHPTIHTLLSTRGSAVNTDPLLTPKADYEDLINRISVANSPVGIDAQYTHSIIITYLQQIAARLDALEAKLSAERPF